MRTIATITSIGVGAVALLAAGCDGTPSSGQDPTTTTPPALTEEAPPAPPPATDTPAGEPAQQWTMPDLVGSVLQDAQDQVQTLTGGAVYFTDSHDLTGQDRNQVVDANWRVCTQNIAPGATITPTSVIDLGVVKLDEACP